MILAMDVGNSQIYCGVFDQDKIVVRFRKNSSSGLNSDELGLFLKSALRENKVDPDKISKIAVCSVVPDLVHSIKNCCKKYFDLNPFILQPGVKTGLKIRYKNPNDVGADRIANAIAATQLFPNQNVIVVDFGTATTFCAISKEKDYLGGIILPGLRISMEALEKRTAKLPKTEIRKPAELVARTTEESIQSGLYYGNLAILQQMTLTIKRDYFKNEKTLVIGTGGFSSLFREENIFDVTLPDMVLIGLHETLRLNT